jgi:hypothetical protein
MSFQWLQLRISEEQERREREARIQAMLPNALEELHRSLAACVADYTEAFGREAADVHFADSRIGVSIREEQEGEWRPRVKVEVIAVASLPGFRIERGGEPLHVEVGMLPGDKAFYKDQDEYIGLEELTRRILDRAFFPKLSE